MPLYVTYFPGKITNLEYGNYSKKTFSKMSYHVRSFMAFKPNNKGYGQNHSIVCDNVPILYTCVYLGIWQTMLPKGVFILFAQKMIFHFPSAKKGFFCEAATKNVLPKWGTQFFINSRPHFICNSLIDWVSKLSIHFSAK